MLLPNPARDYFKIISSDNVLPIWITMTDAGGIVVLNKKPDQSLINTSGFTQGLFIFELRYKDEVIRKKLVVH